MVYRQIIMTFFVTVMMLFAHKSLGAQVKQTSAFFDGENISAACGFTTLSELNIEAQIKLKQFSSIKNFDPMFWESDPVIRENEIAKIIEKKNRLKTFKETESEKLPFAKTLFEIHSKLVEMNFLNLFKQFEVADLDLTTPCDLACGQGIFVGFSSKFAQALFEKYPETFELKSKFIIAHEIAHMVYDYGLWTSKKFKSIEEYRDFYKTLSYRKLHLTVDAIGMFLSNITPENAATTLEESTSMDVQDQSKGPGDAARRIFCLRNLR